MTVASYYLEIVTGCRADTAEDFQLCQGSSKSFLNAMTMHTTMTVSFGLLYFAAHIFSSITPFVFGKPELKSPQPSYTHLTSKGPDQRTSLRNSSRTTTCHPKSEVGIVQGGEVTCCPVKVAGVDPRKACFVVPFASSENSLIEPVKCSSPLCSDQQRNASVPAVQRWICRAQVARSAAEVSGSWILDSVRHASGTFLECSCFGTSASQASMLVVGLFSSMRHGPPTLGGKVW